jgi:hypothetical protein
MVLVLTILAIAALQAGCTQPSFSVETREILASFNATTDGSPATTVRASLKVNLVQDVILDNGDALYAEVGDRRVAMPMVDPGDYAAVLLDLPPLSTITFDLDRPGGDSAADNRVVIPPAFELEPLAQASYGRNDTIPLRWNPSVPGAIAITLAGDCIVGKFATVIDTGSHDVSGLATLDYPEVACEVTVTVTRSLGGIVDRALDGLSGIRADQVRTLTFTSTP